MTGTAASTGSDPADDVEALLARAQRRRRPRWHWVAMGLTLVLIVGWAFVAARGLGTDPGVVRSALIGKPMPAFRLPALGGGEIDDVSLRGDIVVVNFWASWCIPCREEAPELQGFAERWSGRGVTLIGIVYSDEEKKAVEFREEFDLSYPQALDPGGRTAIDFGVFGVPETFVVDRSGVVKAKMLGAVSASTLEDLVAAVEAGRSVSDSNDRYRTAPG